MHIYIINHHFLPPPNHPTTTPIMQPKGGARQGQADGGTQTMGGE